MVPQMHFVSNSTSPLLDKIKSHQISIKGLPFGILVNESFIPVQVPFLSVSMNSKSTFAKASRYFLKVSLLTVNIVTSCVQGRLRRGSLSQTVSPIRRHFGNGSWFYNVRQGTKAVRCRLTAYKYNRHAW